MKEMKNMAKIGGMSNLEHEALGGQNPDGINLGDGKLNDILENKIDKKFLEEKMSHKANR